MAVPYKRMVQQELFLFRRQVFADAKFRYKPFDKMYFKLNPIYTTQLNLSKTVACNLLTARVVLCINQAYNSPTS
jgi:hypothetical protein